MSRGENENRPKKKLLVLVREAIWRKHYSKRTEESYIHWIYRYIFFDNKRYTTKMGIPEIEAFLTYLAIIDKLQKFSSIRL